MPTTTRIEVTADGTRLRHGLLAARPLRHRAPRQVRMALVATQALLLAGDHVHIEVDVVGDLELEIVEPAGTVAYDMRGGSARWDVTIRLRAGARLTWLAEPVVVAAGAHVVRSTTVRLESGTSAALRDALVLGRTGESGGTVLTNTHASIDDTPLLVEELDLSPDRRRGPATLGRHRCVDTLTTLGRRLPAAAGTMQLDGPGSVQRWMGSHMHQSALLASVLSD